MKMLKQQPHRAQEGQDWRDRLWLLEGVGFDFGLLKSQFAVWRVV